ncbi:hypothetical protein CAPTEDRAFT_211815 [Capitella teleta]|uniref:SAM domain-containing protein n=1 Tax=Capitella teleta TaxID=283909 RepID=R7UZN4_CAPTE|nr:hypothetical protein CAPTEDRAFT_211815 [Capitella teleta]|eukprot:ELU11697.1 hypothetical protein CAPTEDRAFT_211815 [Capitella teleta]
MQFGDQEVEGLNLDSRLRKIETTEDLNTEELIFIAQMSEFVIMWHCYIHHEFPKFSSRFPFSPERDDVGSRSLEDFLRGRGLEDGWRRFVEEKVDENIINISTDEQLQTLGVQHFGDVVASRTFCQGQLKATRD